MSTEQEKSMSKYHPEYDNASNYLEAAKNQADPETKILLEKAAATIAYLQKHRQGTQALLVQMNNTIVNAGDELCSEDLEIFFPDILHAIETADDVNNKFSTPYESWSLVARQLEPGNETQTTARSAIAEPDAEAGL